MSINFPQIFQKVSLSDTNLIENLLGKRIELNGYSGTIRYSGPLKHKKDNDVWVGIDWDDKSRGKHNGTVENTLYFSCNYSIHDISVLAFDDLRASLLEIKNINKTNGNKSNSLNDSFIEKSQISNLINSILQHNPGSLIKANKVNIGQSFMEAVKFKYKFDEYADELSKFINESAEKSLYIQTKTKKIEIEVLGKQKTTNWYDDYSKIVFLDLANSRLNSYDFNDFSIFTNLQELTITNSLFTNWSSLGYIILGFNNLKSFNFSENNLVFDEEELDKLKEKIKEKKRIVECLILNRNNLTLFGLKKIEFILKRINSLYFYGNYINYETLKKEYMIENINNYENEDKLNQTLEDFKIDLSETAIISLENNLLEDVLPTLKFFNFSSNLKSLNLNNNKIQNLFEYKESFNEKFIKEMKLVRATLEQNLETLFLDGNRISDSKILSEFNHFSKLKNLFIVIENPFFKSCGLEKSFKYLIGRILSLKNLNNNIILKTERKEYEKHYLKKVVEVYFSEIKPIKVSSEFDQVHFDEYVQNNYPSFNNLKKMYFNPVDDYIGNMKLEESNRIKMQEETKSEEFPNCVVTKQKNRETNPVICSGVSNTSNSKGLSSTLVGITFDYNGKKILKKITKTTTFNTLRTLVSNLFKINEFSFMIKPQGVDFNIIDEGKTLEGYEIIKDTTIYIN